jgi:hypothetical protein
MRAGETTDRRQDLPVYELVPLGSRAVATGRIFVRFAEQSRAEDAREALQHAGYQVEKIPPWATHTCWVRAESGNVAAALQGLPTLAKLPGIENVEPQMLMPRVHRNPGT